jgi:hypothetical protein
MFGMRVLKYGIIICSDETFIEHYNSSAKGGLMRVLNHNVGLVFLIFSFTSDRDKGWKMQMNWL